MSFKLKDIGAYLDYPFKHEDLDGRLVACAYLEHLETGKKLPKKYLEYNKDDVFAIPFIINELSKRKDILVDIIEEKNEKRNVW